MKHTFEVTAVLVIAFLIIQFFGLFALSENTVVAVTPEGNVTVEHHDTVVGERPEIEGGCRSPTYFWAFSWEPASSCSS